MATELDKISDYKSVSIRGAFNFGRARALWADGLLRVCGSDGRMLELIADRPVRKAGYLRAWDCKTSKGLIELRSKCITCGGKAWWSVVFMPAETLWASWSSV